MALEQATQNTINKRLEQIDFLKKRIAKFDELSNYSKGKHWECLKGILDEAAINAQTIANNEAENPSSFDAQYFSRIAKAQEARDRLRWVIKLMTDPKEMIETCRTRIAELQEEIKMKKEEGISG